MKSQYNFYVVKDNKIIADMHEIGVWVESFHILSPNISREKLKTKNRPGILLANSQQEERYVDIVMQIEADSTKQFDEKKHHIYDIFFSDELFIIIRDLVPDRQIEVMQEEYYDISNLTPEDGELSLRLTMPNPYLEANSIKEISTLDASVPVIVQSTGTAPTPPTFTVTLNGPTEFLDIIGDEDYMRIGSPSQVDETPFQKKETIKSLKGSFVEWTSALFTPDGGVKTGEFGLASQDYIATSYGTGNAWHGPALAQSVGSAEDDYLVRAYFNVGSNNGARTRAEVYLLDEAGLIIGKLAAVVRRASGEVDIEINIRNGSDSHFFVSDKWNYKEFFGYIDIQKEGNVFTAAAAQQGFNENGELYTRNKKTYLFNDLNNQYQKPLAAVGMHIGSYGSHPFPTQSRIRRIDVQRIKDQPNGIEYIGQAGDVFRFDHGQEAIYKNDELFMRKDFGSRFFHLKKGDNVLVLNPANAIQEFKAEWRERYK
ncbi:phage distal tail protein [Bacillus suaedae]|nr:phage tail domain-containing protein [Bacillus suaedae]